MVEGACGYDMHGLLETVHAYMVSNFYISAYLVNIANEPFEFHRLPNMIKNHYYAGCGKFSGSNGESLVIVAGGLNNHEFGVLSSSEILSLVDLTWSKGPSLPRGFALGAHISDDEHPLILLGGLDEKGMERNTVMHYSEDSNIFEYLPGKLKTARYQFAASTSYTEEDC